MVRTERQEDALASRRLLPEPPGDWLWSGRFVAANHDNQVVAAAGLWRGTEHFRCDIRCGDAGLDIGVLAPLWQLTKQEAVERGGDQVVGLRPIAFDSDEAAQWLALGFKRDGIRITYESSYERGFAELERTLSKLRERGKIPAGASVVDLREAPLAEVANLLVQGIGMSRSIAAHMLSGAGPRRIHPTLSCVAMCDGEVVALNLASRIDHSTARLDSIVVKPGWRGGWANVWVKHEGARRAIASGKLRIVAETGDEHADSRRQAQRNGAAVLEKTFLPVYRLHREEAGVRV